MVFPLACKGEKAPLAFLQAVLSTKVLQVLKRDLFSDLVLKLDLILVLVLKEDSILALVLQQCLGLDLTFEDFILASSGVFMDSN